MEQKGSDNFCPTSDNHPVIKSESLDHEIEDDLIRPIEHTKRTHGNGIVLKKGKST